jgi:hypothetical protein
VSFLAPLMLLGILGAAIPLALHLIGRRRARRIRFAALDFLLGSDRRLARSVRLRERLLLLARVLACVAIAAALAKPFVSCAASGPEIARGAQAAVIVVDDGFAAGYEVGGERTIERARRAARGVLDRLGPEAEVAIVTTAREVGGGHELSRDHLRLREDLARLEPTAKPGDLGGALRRSARLLAGSSQGTRTIYVVAPVTSAGLGREPPWPPGTGPGVVVLDPTDGAELANAAVTDVVLAPDPEAGPRGVRVTAEVVQHGGAPGPRELRLELDGKVVARGAVALTPERPERKAFSIALPAGARAAELVVALTADALPIDDRRHAIARPRAAVPVLLVDGDPRTVRHDDELFYLAAALRPGDRDDGGAVLTTATVDELDELDLARFHVIALCNARALAAPVAARLDAWVRTGGGLLVTAGTQVDPEAWNAAMGALLPQALATASRVGFGGADAAGQALRLGQLELDHPLFAPFDRDARALIDARFQTVLLLGPVPDVTGRRVLARYDNGAVAIVEREVGAGKVLLYTSTIDRDWTDLPIQPGFLPLVQQAVRYLARRPLTDRRRDVRVGEPVVIEVAPGDTRIEVARPDGERRVFPPEELAERAQLRFGETDGPGIYRVVGVGAAGKAERDEQGFAVHLDPVGSDLRRAPDDAIPSGATAGRGEGGAAPLRRVELWHGVAAALLLLLLLESVLLTRS